MESAKKLPENYPDIAPSSSDEQAYTSEHTSSPLRTVPGPFNPAGTTVATPIATNTTAQDTYAYFDDSSSDNDEVAKRHQQQMLQQILAKAEKSDSASLEGAFASTSNFGVGTPEQLIANLEVVGYQCLHQLAVQICLLLNSPYERPRALLLEGPSGCGKSFMAKSLAKITGAEFMCLSCYAGMPLQNLIEYPSTLAVVSQMAGAKNSNSTDMMNLGPISRAFKKSQEKPVIVLIDELDKTSSDIDTFFLGPIQDGKLWLESQAPIEANIQNLLIILTKNFNRKIDDALVRRCHPVKMTYLDSTLERKILSKHCNEQLVDNLVNIADRMRNADGSYTFERPPAPEELLACAHYTINLLRWGILDHGQVGKSLFPLMSKSDHDRAVLEHMLRFHHDFLEPGITDPRCIPVEKIYAKLGRLVLKGIVDDVQEEQRLAKLRETEGEW